jgi:DnaJ-class molecular chaperone with C-terminal Zn finger domain
MLKRDPHIVLGVQSGASSATIKAAWRRLARANHPDLTGDDPAASRVATRRMAEINDAYAALVRSGETTSEGGRRPDGTPFEGEEPARRGGPPAPKPTRPVTGRLDTSATYRPRNESSSDRTNGIPLSGQAPLRADVAGRELPRASVPNGPLVRDRVRDFRRPKPPTLAAATAHLLAFGKFHGHTLGQVAAFEPSYVDWLVGTVMRDPDVAAAARVVQADLDRRGVQRGRHPSSSSRSP